ncbi:MAG TPA: alkaline phosphatase family protein [Bacteroidales bacterium]|nr:alkaline phosphatase family protein [Bacteroidales bacterium]
MKKVFLTAFICSLSLFIKAQSQAYIPPEKPKLVIGIVIEQLRYDQLERLISILPEDGIRKMMNEGTYYKNASFNYLLSQAAPGYATISTGTDPSYHGMTSDSWYNLFNDQVIYCVQDSKSNPVGGSFEGGLFSPSNLIASTFADELKMATCGQAKVYGIGMKEMAAIITAGHSADGAFWYDDKTGTWMSSTYYTNALPGWLMDFNASMAPEVYLSGTWKTFKDPSVYPGCGNDTSKYERGFDSQTWFPYDLDKLSKKDKPASQRRNYGILRETPFADDFTTDLALKIIENEGLGQDDVVDFLSVSYSAEDYIGHRFGPSSVEAADAIVRLDRNISRIIEEVNRKIGKKNVLIYFVAAHGVSEIPAVLEANRIPSGYFKLNQSLQLLRSYLNAVYGQGDWIKGFHDNQIFLNRTLIEDANISLEEMQKKIARFMVQFSGIVNAVPCSLIETGTFSEGLLEKMSNSTSPQRSGDVMIVLNPGWVEKGDNVTNHNSPYEYDLHVPLIWYGWTTNKALVTRKVDIKDIAVTLSDLCKVGLPNSANGNPLTELFR